MSCEVALQNFISESRELLQIMEAALLCVEQGKMDAEILYAVCRTANTIKSNAGLFGLAQVVGFIHVTESVLDKIRNAKVCIDRKLSVLLLECIDHIGVLIEDLEKGVSPSEPSQRRCNELTQRLIACVESDLEAMPPSPAFRAPRTPAADRRLSLIPNVGERRASRFSEYLELLQSCSRQEIRFDEMLKRFGALTQHELARVLQRQMQVIPGDEPACHPDVIALHARTASPAEATVSGPHHVIMPVDTTRLTHLMTLLDELVTVGDGARRLAQRVGDTELEATASSLSRLADEIRDSSLRLGVKSFQ